MKKLLAIILSIVSNTTRTVNFAEAAELRLTIIGRHEANTALTKLDRATKHGQLLYGTRSDISAQQQNHKYRKYWFDSEGRPLTWKMPVKPVFAGYPIKYWGDPRNEEIAIMERNAIIREYNNK